MTSSLRILVKPTECYEHFTSMMYSLLSFPTMASTHIISRPPPNNWLHSSTHILYLQRNLVKKKKLKSSGYKNDKTAKKYQAILAAVSITTLLKRRQSILVYSLLSTDICEFPGSGKQYCWWRRAWRNWWLECTVCMEKMLQTQKNLQKLAAANGAGK